MENLNITFAPELPIWFLAIITAAIALLCLYGLFKQIRGSFIRTLACLLYTSPSPRDRQKSRMPSSA